VPTAFATCHRAEPADATAAAHTTRTAATVGPTTEPEAVIIAVTTTRPGHAWVRTRLVTGQICEKSGHGRRQ
jgi:hypothetical protein